MERGKFKMFGETVERYCENCKKDVVIKGVSLELRVKDKVYYESLNCPYCAKDLSELDRKQLQKAKENGEQICVVMC